MGYRTHATNTGTSTTTAVTITPAVGDLFMVACEASFNTNDTPTCADDNGGTYTRLESINHYLDDNYRLMIFVRDQLLTNTTSTVVTVTNGACTVSLAAVFAFSGVTRAGTLAIRNTGKETDIADGNTPAPALGAAALTDSIMWGVVGTNIAPALTPPSSWTESLDTNFGPSSIGVGMEAGYRDSGFTGTTVTWGSGLSGSDGFASFVAEIDTRARTGDAAITLADVTTTATGVLPLVASATPTLGDVSLQATGSVDNTLYGQASLTLDGVTTTATGRVAAAGAGSPTLAGATVTSAGASAIRGSAAITLDAIYTLATSVPRPILIRPTTVTVPIDSGLMNFTFRR